MCMLGCDMVVYTCVYERFVEFVCVSVCLSVCLSVSVLGI